MTICEDSRFLYNRAHNDGGVIDSYEHHTLVIGNGFESNNARNRGGVLSIYRGSFALVKNILSHNEAAEGGVIYADQGNVTMETQLV